MMTGSQSKLGLTGRELEVLNHRLEASDCIADALADDFATEDVDHVCGLLLAGDIAGAMEHSEAATFAVLADAVTGSTWLGSGLEGFGSPIRLAAAEGVCERLASKVSRFIGRDIRHPLC